VLDLQRSQDERARGDYKVAGGKRGGERFESFLGRTAKRGRVRGGENGSGLVAAGRSSGGETFQFRSGVGETGSTTLAGGGGHGSRTL